MNYHMTKRSGNKKVGPIPVTVSHKDTCPDACPLKDNGCYASAGFHTRMHWDKVTSGERGTNWEDFLSKIEALPQGQLWRHNVSGDLKGRDNLIHRRSLVALTRANEGKRGFTYTHYPVDSPNNLSAIRAANRRGFTVNVSADSTEEALDTHKRYRVPTVTIVPSDYWAEGNKVDTIARCPAEYKDTNCKECGLCQKADRGVIVGFTVHGTQAKKAEVIARG